MADNSSQAVVELTWLDNSAYCCVPGQGPLPSLRQSCRGVWTVLRCMVTPERWHLKDTWHLRHTWHLIYGSASHAPYAQDHFMAPVHFHEQYNTFHAQGYGAAPEGQGFVGAAQPEGTRSPKRQRLAQVSHSLST